MPSECTPADPASAAPAPTAASAAAPASSWRTMLELAVLGAIWGGSFLFMRVAATDFGPIPLVEMRLALGALILLPFLWQARAQFTPRLWLPLARSRPLHSAIPP